MKSDQKLSSYVEESADRYLQDRSLGIISAAPLQHARECFKASFLSGHHYLCRSTHPQIRLRGRRVLVVKTGSVIEDG